MEDAKLSALQRLFDLKCPTKPTQKDALLLRDIIFLLVDEDLADLKNLNARAYAGLKEFMEDPDIFIGGSVEDEEHKRILNVLIGREEPKLPPRHESQTNLFDPDSTGFSHLDVQAIGHRYALERGDEKVLSAAVIDQIDGFVSDPTSYIIGIDATARPKLDAEQIVQLQGLLTELSEQLPPLSNAKLPVAEPAPVEPPALVIPDPKPIANPPTPQAKAPEPPVALPAPAPAPAPAVVTPVSLAVIAVPNMGEMREMPRWVTWLHQDPRCAIARKKIEEAFADSRNSDPAIRKKGLENIAAWKRSVQLFHDGCAGPDLVNLGRHMLHCIFDHENNIDPNSAIYKHLYITS